MVYDYQITYDFEYEEQDYVWQLIPLLELLAKLKVGIVDATYKTNHVGDTILVVHFRYYRQIQAHGHS